jgi:hypothetical protein
MAESDVTTSSMRWRPKLGESIWRAADRRISELERQLEAERQPRALLGLASTRQLLEELDVRGRVPQPGDEPEGSKGLHVFARFLLDTLPATMLDYRPAGGPDGA